MKVFLLPEDLHAAVLKYLLQRPMEEVEQAVKALRNLTPVTVQMPEGKK